MKLKAFCSYLPSPIPLIKWVTATGDTHTHMHVETWMSGSDPFYLLIWLSFPCPAALGHSNPSRRLAPLSPTQRQVGGMEGNSAVRDRVCACQLAAALCYSSGIWGEALPFLGLSPFLLNEEQSTSDNPADCFHGSRQWRSSTTPCITQPALRKLPRGAGLVSYSTHLPTDLGLDWDTHCQQERALSFAHTVPKTPLCSRGPGMTMASRLPHSHVAPITYFS